MKHKPKTKRSFTEKIGYKFFPTLMLHKKSEALPLTLNWRRIFILPTKPGLFFAFVTLLMLIASLNFNNNMGLMMTFLLFGLAQVSLYRVFFNLRNLTITQVEAKPVFLGKKAQFHIKLRADEDKFDICLQQNTFHDCLIKLPAEKIAHLNCQIQTFQRGWITCGKVKIFSSFPFGLFQAWIWTNFDSKCLVYPTPEDSPPPLPLHAISDGKTAVFSQGEDFHGLKPYQAGDALRLIAWKRTAQTGELISREFQQTRGDKLVLDFNQIQLNDIEQKLSRLTAWVITAQHQQVDYCLKLPHFNSGFGYSNKHYLKCLKALALYGVGT